MLNDFFIERFVIHKYWERNFQKQHFQYLIRIYLQGEKRLSPVQHLDIPIGRISVSEGGNEVSYCSIIELRTVR